MAKYSIFGLFDMLHPHMTYDEMLNVFEYQINLKRQNVKRGTDRKIRVTFTDTVESAAEEFMRNPYYADGFVPRHVKRSALSKEDLIEILNKDVSFKNAFTLYGFIFYNREKIESLMSQNRTLQAVVTMEHELEHVYQYSHDIKDKIDYSKYHNYALPKNYALQLIATHGEERYNRLQHFIERSKDKFDDKYYLESYVENSAHALSKMYLGVNLLRYVETKKDLPLTTRVWLHSQAKEILKPYPVVSGGYTKYENYYVEMSLTNALYMADRSKQSINMIKTLLKMTDYCELSPDFRRDYATYCNLKFNTNVSLEDINNSIANNFDKIDYEVKTDYYKEQKMGVKTFFEEHKDELDEIDETSKDYFKAPIEKNYAKDDYQIESDNQDVVDVTNPDDITTL